MQGGYHIGHSYICEHCGRAPMRRVSGGSLRDSADSVDGGVRGADSPISGEKQTPNLHVDFIHCDFTVQDQSCNMIVETSSVSKGGGNTDFRKLSFV